MNCERFSGGYAECGRADGIGWVELRDEAGKLQGMWNPAAGVLEIQRRGVKTRYWLHAGQIENSHMCLPISREESGGESTKKMPSCTFPKKQGAFDP